MALEVGVNLGFVLASPDADPDEDDAINVDGVVFACRHTSPPGAYRITELGWWQDYATNSPGDYNMGVYDDDDNAPNTLIEEFTGQTTTDSTQAWFKYTGLDIAISPNTIYWIALGMEVLNFPDVVNRTCIAGNPWCTGLAYHWDQTADGSLPNPFVSDGYNDNISFTIYAKYEAKIWVPQAYMIMRGY